MKERQTGRMSQKRIATDQEWKACRTDAEEWKTGRAKGQRVEDWMTIEQ